MLTAMWVFPLVAALVAFAFAAALPKQFAERHRPYQLLWALSLVMYGAASIALVVGVVQGWSASVFGIFWALGAVLNVPFLAAGEVELLARNRTVDLVVDLILIFLVAYTVAVLRKASVDTSALAERLPSGKHVFGAGSPAHRLPQLISIPSYLILLLGTLWSAWKMRGRPELRDRFIGTLLIALGATVIAGFGSAFAATGLLPAFSVALLVGIAVMFAGFLRASRPVRVPETTQTPPS